MKPTRKDLRTEIVSMLPSFYCINIDGFRGQGYISLEVLQNIRNELILWRKLI